VDDIDRQLLIELQKEIPLHTRPFEAIGRKISLDSADVILRIHRLQEEGVLDPIYAVFDMSQAAYQKVGVAMKVAAEAVDRAAAILCRHPGIPQCSKWQGEFNLWFTLALPMQESLEDHCGQLAQLAGAEKLLVLRTLKIYKPAEAAKSGKRDLNEAEIHLVRILQEEFPLTDEPFRRWAKLAGISDESLFQQIQIFQKRGFLKRIAAFNGFSEKSAENAVAMWRIPEEKIDFAGYAAASFPEVSSCIRRAVSSEMPYSLHAVLKGSSETVCMPAVKAIEEKIGAWPSQFFLKEKDYKKRRLKYFSEDLQDWREKQKGVVSSGSTT
jgi:siroheme decarboxylase